jgi:cytidine deaminase
MANELIETAIAARERAIAPHSGFRVGTAIETGDGRIYAGCNIENASYGLTVCAERVALWKALSEGARQFLRIAIVTDAPEPTPPCGACRQLLWEYGGNMEVVSFSLGGTQQSFWLADLLPHPFDERHLRP